MQELYMDSLDPSKISFLTSDQLKIANEWTLKEWQQNIPRLSPEQINSIFSLASKDRDPGTWKVKNPQFDRSFKYPSTP